jgi:hypothetical protein
MEETIVMQKPKLEQLEGLSAGKREESPIRPRKARCILGVERATGAIGSNNGRNLAPLDVGTGLLARVLDG